METWHWATHDFLRPRFRHFAAWGRLRIGFQFGWVVWVTPYGESKYPRFVRNTSSGVWGVFQDYNLAGGSSLRGCKGSKDDKRKLLAVVYFKDNQGHEKGIQDFNRSNRGFDDIGFLGGWLVLWCWCKKTHPKSQPQILGYWLVFGLFFLWLLHFIPWNSSPLKLRIIIWGIYFLDHVFRKAPFGVCHNYPLWKNGYLSWSSAALVSRGCERQGTSALRISLHYMRNALKQAIRIRCLWLHQVPALTRHSDPNEGLEADWWERMWLLDPCWEDGWGAWLCAGLGSPTGQLYKCGYKELFHRQLYQDLTGSELPEGVDIRMLLRPAVSNVICNNRPMNYLVAYNQMVSNRL